METTLTSGRRLTFGGKELPREGHTLRGGQRLQQTLQALSAGADRQRPRHTIPRGHTPRSSEPPRGPVGLEAQAAYWQTAFLSKVCS